MAGRSSKMTTTYWVYPVDKQNALSLFIFLPFAKKNNILSYLIDMKQVYVLSSISTPDYYSIFIFFVVDIVMIFLVSTSLVLYM